ncbi:MAG: PH domain-containing protein [Candidatus Rokuibacteriota bacterium]
MYPATLGVRERWSTVGAVVLGVVVFSAAGLAFTVKTGDPRWLFFGLPFTLLLFVMGRYAPTGFRLASDGIHVERRAGAKVIPYRAIRAADDTPRSVVGMSIFGSRGVFGRFGRFWNGSLGHYELFLTNRSGVVWLDTAKGWVGLSPDNPQQFLEQLRARLALVR